MQVPSPRSRPGWPSVRRRRDLGAVGPPSGWSPARGCPRRRPGRSLPCPPPLVRRGDVRPAGRADVQCPGRPVSGVRCPVSRRPGIQVSGRTSSGVRGAAATLSAPRRTLEWLGVAGRPRLAPAGRRARWSAGGVVACRLRPDGKGDGAALAVAGSHEVDRSQGRRLAGVPAAAPPWPQRAGTGAGPGQGAGRGRGAWRGMGGSRCSPAPAGRPGRSRRRGADHGLAQQLVTTLRGRWARVVPWRPAPEGPPGSVGEQPAAVARPRCVRSAVG